jgi:hypothetical protein
VSAHLPTLSVARAGPNGRRARYAGLLFALLCVTVTAHAQSLFWSVPDDGGTPREAARIEKISDTEFRIRATIEEPQSPLKHAVSRLELVCHNPARQPQTVTVHLDLSGDGQRTDFSTTDGGGMPQRDFIFIQSPGGPWQQIEGKTQGWVATVSFTIAPGETKVGLNPWYSYRDYLQFVTGLRPHPHLQKHMVTQSDGGREHWELTITDPEVPPAKKRTVFWHAREHSYETFSSFAMEGLIAYLLSDEAAEARRQFVFAVQPMTNVDGVAQGHEYRMGYDFPNPRDTSTGRMSFATIDRLHPDFAITWHNWIAPRDRDVIFYTDSDAGKATSRAWYFFAQRFKSPQLTEHRWKDELTTLRPNWFGRPLGIVNLHQYAMKQYGTKIWGWEMPWWNRNPADARVLGADFARAWLGTIAVIDRGEKLPPAAPAFDVPRWEMHEFVLHGTTPAANPFREAALAGEFTSPSGKTRAVDGFYDGGDTWRLRFAPDEEGEWKYTLHGEGVSLFQQGRFRCTAPRGHGSIRIHPENPYAFAYADGAAFFPMGDTCYGLFDDSPITPELRAAYLKKRREQRFNFVRLQVGGSPFRALSDPAYWAWGGTAKAPDLERFNPVFFQNFDRLISQMRDAGMKAELILLNFYRLPFTDPALWTAERERRWLSYLTARYGAFDNIFLWTIANEYETHPDGKYRLDNPADVDWAKRTARYIKAHDAHRHLVTVHPVMPATVKGTSTRDGFDPPWRIGEFYGLDDAMDVISQQTGKSGDGVVWDDQLQCWTGDATSLLPSLRADRRYGKPVLNSENGYEYLRGYPTGRRQVHHTDMVRHTSWRIVCGGGWFAAGFRSTLGHSDNWNQRDPASHYDFILRDEGAGFQLGVLYDFFSALPFWKMQPFSGVTGDDAVALAETGRIYVIYLPRGGEVSVDLTGVAEAFTATWFNPRLGRVGESIQVQGGVPRKFMAPDGADWVLQLKRLSQGK